MGRSANAALAARWQERIGRWRSSGLSISEFCRREEISQPSFFGWRKRLAGRHAVTHRRGGQPAIRAGRKPRFVELPPLAWSATSGVQIALPGGATVTLPPQAAAELITTAIRAAMSGGTVEDRPC
jgi:hypothetical protein